MKAVLGFFSLVIVASSSLGAIDSFYITASGGDPIPATYDMTNTQSLVMTGLKYKLNFCAYNGTSTKIAINIDNGSIGTNPTSSDGVREIIIPPAMGRCVNTAISSRVYLRGLSSITSGYVVGDAN